MQAIAFALSNLLIHLRPSSALLLRGTAPFSWKNNAALPPARQLGQRRRPRCAPPLRGGELGLKRLKDLKDGVDVDESFGGFYSFHHHPDLEQQIFLLMSKGL